ncbi:hypothetical protein GWK47_024866 [Chionoecetes opilio]|uniref:Uncharacterized protein n=1 Tax=Chionoecetes opilio TaxID=41210 RepID=A0A8J4XKW1_CHIOP|nr:hypothetical protein GWK47_024866 [Chionoecetes opilio]
MDGLEQAFSLSTPAAPWSSLQQLHCSVPAASCKWRGNNHNVIIIFIPAFSVWFLFLFTLEECIHESDIHNSLMVQPIPLDKFFFIQLAENVSSGTKMPELALAEELVDRRVGQRRALKCLLCRGTQMSGLVSSSRGVHEGVVTPAVMKGRLFNGSLRCDWNNESSRPI